MMIIKVAARQSPLSKVQTREVFEELVVHHPNITFDIVWVETTGDKDRKTSLRTLGKTDFFTKEIDELILSKQCRIGIHSAKDLPDPLPKGLHLAATTKGLDSRDSLVLRDGDTLDSLPPRALIATSSLKREEVVRTLRTDFTFQDIRGTIEERLEYMKNGNVDGVVVAEAALIRLGLTHLNRIFLPGETTKGQGRLAIIVHENDEELKTLFKVLDQ